MVEPKRKHKQRRKEETVQLKRSLGKKQNADPDQKDVQNQEPKQNANNHKNKQASQEAQDRLHVQQWLNAEPEIAEKQTTE